MKQYIMFSLVLLIFFTIGCNKSYATKELPMETAQLARSSTDVLVAICISNDIKKDDDTGFPFTYTTFEVTDSLKSKYDKKDQIVLRIVGGMSGDVTTDVPSKPEFEENGEYVLFLGPDNNLGYQVLESFSRGVYKVVEEEGSGNKVIETPVSGLELYSEVTKGRVPSTDEKLSLVDFLYSLNRVIQ